MFIDQINEIPLGKTRECRLTKMRILAQISARFDIKIGKVAAPTARHEDFAPWFFTIIDQQNPASCLTCQRRTEHTRRTSAYNNGIKPFHVALLLEKTGVNCKDSSVVAPASILLKGSIYLNYIR